ncbi:MAG: efflux RND transporter permease subunit [Deltaproteobacteria bacterium]|nr:efflux RND transporter permease subunit [Deltaproteobacteria bacterium]
MNQKPSNGDIEPGALSIIDKTIRLSLKFRGLVLVGVFAVIALGLFRYSDMPVDAFPDISPIMVPVFAEAHGMAPEEIERLITYPIESAMNGLPGVRQIKSTSAFGMAVIYVYFEDNVNIYFARQLVAERLSGAMSDLPEMHDPPTLGPISTGLGQIFMYYLTMDESVDTGGKAHDLYLRELNDWVIKFQLQTVPGVTDILSIGGHVLQFQIKIDPYALQKFGLSLEDVTEAVQDNNRNAGGQFLVLGAEEYLVRGLGLLESLEDIRNVAVSVVDGIPITIDSLATVDYGNEIRRGVVTRNGEMEVVSGLVLKLFGENTSEVIDRLYRKVDEVKNGLPEGVQLVPYYEQAELIHNATWTVKKALLQGALLVLFTLALFLGNFRSSLIVAISLPFCALIAVIFMRLYGVSANLMSLGGIAIAIGMLGDGTIVMVENIYRHLNTSRKAGRDRLAVIFSSAQEVSKPIAFSIAIIIVVFLPVFTLQNVEGKMFSPMAFTTCFALVGSLVYAIIVSPVLASFLLKQGKQKELWIIKYLKMIYRPMLEWTVRWKRMVVGLALGVFLAAVSLLPFIGREFMPTLEEGSILLGVTMPPSIALEKATQTIMNLEKKIILYDEVEETISRIGRPEAGSHPHPVNYAEIHMELKPSQEWSNFDSKQELIEALSKDLSSYPGVQLTFTQPIQNAFDELLSGIKAQLAIKLYGEDLNVLRQKAKEVHMAIRDVPGLVDLSVEQSFGQPQIQILADRPACSRFGVTVDQILELVEMAVGGEVIDNIYLNTRRFGIHVRYQESYRADPEAIQSMLIHTGDGSLIPLSQVAEVKEVIGPIQINREKNQRRWIVQGNVRGRDLGGVVGDVHDRISEKVNLPPGYFIEYGGQFENQQRAMRRLSIIVPIVIALVFGLLWISFGSARQALIVILNIPLGLVGGVLGLYVVGEHLSVPASVGFIALFGIGVQNGVVLVTYLNQHRKQRIGFEKALIEGALLRLRPVLMTAVTTVLGLLPLMLARGIGSEVQRPLATVVVFGLTTSTLMTLFIIPAIYGWIEGGKNIEKRATS